MELKEFIVNVLSDISEGILESQKRNDKSETIISPHVKEFLSPESKFMGNITMDSLKTIVDTVHYIDFEVELANIENTEGKSGIGVMFANIGIGANHTDGKENSSKTKIKFSIPIIYPPKRFL